MNKTLRQVCVSHLQEWNKENVTIKLISSAKKAKIDSVTIARAYNITHNLKYIKLSEKKGKKLYLFINDVPGKAQTALYEITVKRK